VALTASFMVHEMRRQKDCHKNLFFW